MGMFIAVLADFVPGLLLYQEFVLIQVKRSIQEEGDERRYSRHQLCVARYDRQHNSENESSLKVYTFRARELIVARYA